MKSARVLRMTTTAAFVVMLCSWGIGTLLFYYRLHTGTAGMWSAGAWVVNTTFMEIGTMVTRESLRLLDTIDEIEMRGGKKRGKK